jgi:glycosyltransferase involved in cell wall biosynthesis
MGLPQSYLLQIGAIEENKNVLLTIKAFAEIEKKFPDLFLVVVGGSGNPYYKEKVYEEIDRLKIGKKIIFKSFIQSHELPGLYQGAKALIFPSFYEGFGIPIIESMFSGTPVITSKGGCFHEAGGPGTLYIDPYSKDELSSSMLKLISEDLFRQEVIQQGRDFVKKFHWKNTSRVLKNIYQELI